MRRLIRLFLLVAAFGVLASHARAQDSQIQPVVADLSNHLVAITTGFAGTDVLLYGATDGPGDIIVVLRGPAREETIRRKGRNVGLWVNKDEVTLGNVPSFYMVGASRPIEDIVNDDIRARHQIGADMLQTVQVAASAPDGDIPEFTKALVRRKQEKGLYGSEVFPVSMMGNRLFRADLHFPANVPVGAYFVEVYLVRDGSVVSAEITPLNISKVGVGAEVYDFAYDYGSIYGIIAIVLAVFAGWLAGVIFKKR